MYEHLVPPTTISIVTGHEFQIEQILNNPVRIRHILRHMTTPPMVNLQGEALDSLARITWHQRNGTTLIPVVFVDEEP